MPKWTQKKLDKEWHAASVEINNEKHTVDLLIGRSLRKYEKEGNEDMVRLMKQQIAKHKMELARLEHKKAVLSHEYAKLGLHPPSH